MRRRDLCGMALGALAIFPSLAAEAMHLGERPMSVPRTIPVQERGDEREHCERVEREEREIRERLKRARGEERERLERRLGELRKEGERCRRR